MKKAAIFHYALKFIARQKSRNVFIICIICLTCVFSLYTAALFAGMNSQLRDTIIKTETGHFQLIEKNFYTKNDPQSPLPLNETLQKKLEGFQFTPELILRTTILHPNGAQELTLLGIDPPSHEKVFPLSQHVKGSWPLPNSAEKNIVVGKIFAEKLNLSIGDELIITYQDKNKSILNEALTVSGIYHHYGPGFEAHMAYVSGKMLQQLLDLNVEAPFHRVLLIGQDERTKPKISDENIVVKSWRGLQPELSVSMRLNDGITRALMIFMLIIAYVSIMTPIHLLWEERKGEINLLQTMGAQEKVIYRLGLYEALILTMIALTLSFTIWGILHLYSAHFGLDFSDLGERPFVRSGILISHIVYPVVDYTHAILILLFHGVVIFVSQIMGIKRLLKKETLVGN